MTFWGCNRHKVIYQCFIYAILASAAFYLMGPADLTARLILPIAIIIICAYTFIYPQYKAFDVMKMILTDTSHSSLVPLFNGDFRLRAHHGKSFLRLSSPYIYGFISGFPVSVTYVKGGDGKPNTLHFSFGPFTKADWHNSVFVNTAFDLGDYNTIPAGLRAEIAAHVQDLEGQGYIAPSV